MPSLQKNAVGAIIKARVIEDEVVIDPASATSITMYFQKPSGAATSKTGTAFTDTDSIAKCKYVTETGFLDEIGVWRLQVYLQMPGGGYVGPTEVGIFEVRPNIF